MRLLKQCRIRFEERASGVKGGAFTIDGIPINSYLTRFVWDEARYPTMSPLCEIVDSIHVQVAKIEDDMKVRAAEYSNVRSQLNAINRKQIGIFKMARNVMANQETLNVQVTSKNFTDGLDLVKEAIDRAGYNGRIKLAIDVAATEFCIDYSIVSIEQPFDKDDWEHTKLFSDLGICQVVGDDLLMSNPKRIERAINESTCSGLLLKLWGFIYASWYEEMITLCRTELPGIYRW